MAPQCKKCKGAMHKRSTILASNTKFEIYECEECGNEEQVCKGVIN